MKTYKNIDEYIKDVPEGARGMVREMRALAKKLVPGGEEAIRYGMPTIRMNDTNLIHFAAMKGHFGFYPAPSGVKAFQKEFERLGLSYSKGCVRFPYNKTLPVSLITKIIKLRIKETKIK